MAAPSTTSTESGTPAIKRSRSEAGSDNESSSSVPLSSRRFASKIIDIYVGDERYHFYGHEAFLFQSKDLKTQYEASSRSKKKSNKGPTVLNLPSEEPQDFGQLLEYLYLGYLNLHATEAQGQADELLSIWSMGSKYSLLDMQTHVIRKLEELDIAGKLPTLAFLRLVDSFYVSEVDNGLRRYFAKVATDVVRKIQSADMPVLLDMIAEGGSFASDLFHAHHKAFGLKAAAAATEQSKTSARIKTEGEQQHRPGKRARTNKSMPTSSSPSATPIPADIRTQWDKDNNIPEAWETASTEDKLLATKAENRVPWNEIAESWEKGTGMKTSIDDLIHRYNRIEANVLRLGKRDLDLLISAKSAIESKFHNDKWPLIAAHIVDHGGNEYEPIRLKRYSEALDTVNSTTKSKIAHEEDEQNGTIVVRDGNASDLPVGGVKVENSKPIDVIRKRGKVIKAPTASKARKPVEKKKEEKKDPVFSGNDDGSEDEDTVMASHETSTLFLNADGDGAEKTGADVVEEDDAVDDDTEAVD